MIRVCRSRYRSQDGFLICGRDRYDRPIRIFVRKRETAERIKLAYRDRDMPFDELLARVGRIILSEREES